MGSMTKQFFTATLVLGSLLVMVSACKNEVQKESPTVEATDVNATENFQAGTDSSASAIAAARAGIGCTSDQDQVVVDPDAKANDVETKQIKTTRGKDVITAISTLTVDKAMTDSLFLNKRLMSYSSRLDGEMLSAPVDSTVTCDPQQPANKTCENKEMSASAAAAMKKNLNTNGLVIFREGHASSKCQVKKAADVKVSETDELGTYQMKNGQKINVIRHVKTTTGKIACAAGDVGHGTIREEVISSRDVVGVGELVGCGGIQVVRMKTVTLDRDSTIGDNDPQVITKVIFSQRTEILDTKMRSSTDGAAQGEQK